MRITALFAFLIVCLLLSACGNEGSSAASAVSRVDSATQAAPDTLRASMDTSSQKKDTVPHGAGAH